MENTRSELESSAEFEREAQRYAEHRITRQRLEEEIRAHPLSALALATATGFILAGGPRSRLGSGLIMLGARTTVRALGSGFLLNALGGHAGRQYF